MSDNPSRIMKLPVWRTVKAAYLVIFHNPLLALKLGFVPMCFVIAPAILSGYFWGGAPTEEYAAALVENTGFCQILNFVSYLATIPMITAWHRMVILGHADPDSRLRYSVHKYEWSYLWKGFLFALIVASIYLLGSLVIMGVNSVMHTHAPQDMLVFINWVIAAALVLVFCVYFSRLSLVFPAAAAGKPIGFGESWSKTRGNTVRLFVAACLGFLPFLVVPAVSDSFTSYFWVFDAANQNIPTTPTMPSMASQILMTLMNIPFWLMGICVSVSVMSWAYRYLVQGYPITLPGE